MKKLKIYTAPGIGDCVWAMTKIPDMRKKLKPDHVEVILQATEFNRADDFLMHFDFVNSVRYEEFSIVPELIYFPDIYGMPTPKPTDDEHHFVYYDSTGNFMGDSNAWLLLANSHLEHGRRLETWFPEFETEIHIAKHWVWQEEEIQWAKKFHEETLHDKPYVVFYMGPVGGNTFTGHNRNNLWKLRDWQYVAQSLKSYCPDIQIVMVGAKPDWHYVNLYLGSLTDAELTYHHNLCGQTQIGECFATILRSQFILSYQCGLGIFQAI